MRNENLNIETFNTPVIITEQDQIKHNCKSFMESILVDRLFFPVKVNHNPEVLACLNSLGLSYEIASLGELDLLKELNVDASKILFSNPVKLDSHIQEAYHYGIRSFVLDSKNEVDKIVQEDRVDCEVFIRLKVSNEGADWSLDEKFGVPSDEFIDLYQYAKGKGMHVLGACFHIGWNNTNIETWLNTFTEVKQLYAQCFEGGFSMDFLNIGGGFPSFQVDQYEMIEEIGRVINPVIQQMKNELGISVYAEPGSYIVANTAYMIVTVVEVIDRGENTWVYIDSGIMQGFPWVMKGLEYDVRSVCDSVGLLKEYVVTGPSCDRWDVFGEMIQLPSDLKKGDKLVVSPAGAYINSAYNYNGFGKPEESLL